MNKTEKEIQERLKDMPSDPEGTVKTLDHMRGVKVAEYEFISAKGGYRPSEKAMSLTKLLMEIHAIDEAISAVKLMGAV